MNGVGVTWFLLAATTTQALEQCWNLLPGNSIVLVQGDVTILRVLNGQENTNNCVASRRSNKAMCWCARTTAIKDVPLNWIGGSLWSSYHREVWQMTSTHWLFLHHRLQTTLNQQLETNTNFANNLEETTLSKNKVEESWPTIPCLPPSTRTLPSQPPSAMLTKRQRSCCSVWPRGSGKVLCSILLPWIIHVCEH